MASAMRVFRKFRASDGRIKAVTASGVLALVAVIAMLVGVLPVFATHGISDDETDKGVHPEEVRYGGGAGACDFEEVDSDAEFELHINNPANGVFEGPDGTKVEITLDSENPRIFRYDFIDDPAVMAAYDVVVNGGPHNLWYDNDGQVGPLRSDGNLHAPVKDSGELHNLSHINICYDELFSVSGTKYHDRDADGTQDESEESGLEGWTVAAFDSDGDIVGSDQTDSNGSYTIADLGRGTYTICEQTNTSDLPTHPSDDVTWAWTQSEPSDATSGDCSNFDGYEPFGHTVDINGNDVEDIDFGNHRQVSVTCDAENEVVVTLDGENDEPAASVTFPAGCQSGVGGNDPFTTSFDLGLSGDDDDPWDQFVVFGGDPDSDEILTQTIEWAPEDAIYNDENELVVPTTRVLFESGADLEDVTFCNDIGGDPTKDTPQCLESRSIAEGGDVPDDHIQLTEKYRILGDPPNFR